MVLAYKWRYVEYNIGKKHDQNRRPTKHAREKTYLNGLVNDSQFNKSNGKCNMKDIKICKLSICPLTYETLDPKYHSRSKRKVLEKIYDYEQENNKVLTDLLTNKIQSNA